MEYEAGAVRVLVGFTEGYPYFLQECGKAVWNEAAASPIKEAQAEAVLPLVEAKLDEGFFRVRVDRATDLARAYLRAMAELGPEPQKAGEVARVLGRTPGQLGPIRARLVEKGLLYTPGYGLAAFTVPQFDRFMRRTYALIDLH